MRAFKIAFTFLAAMTASSLLYSYAQDEAPKDEAVKRDGDERRERDGDEREAAKEQELRRMILEAKKLKDAGKNEEAAELLRRVREHAEEFRRGERRELSQEDHAKEALEHLHAATEHLQAAGLKDFAEVIARHGRELHGSFRHRAERDDVDKDERAEGRDRRRDADDEGESRRDRERDEDAERAERRDRDRDDDERKGQNLEKLADQIRELQQQLQQIRKQLDRE